MSSHRTSPNPAEISHHDFESFPAYPSSSAAGPSYQSENINSTTTTTTTTAFDARGVPITTTTTEQPHQIGNVPTIVRTNDPDVIPYTQTTVTVPSQVRRRPIGIRRLPSASAARQSGLDVQDTSSGRRRSNSAPQAPGTAQLSRQNTNLAQSTLPTLPEESGQRLQVPGAELTPEVTAATSTGVGRRRSVSNAARSMISNISRHSNEGDYPTPAPDYDDNVVDFLDVVDPEVSTLTTLTNVQNSLFVPDLGRWINRRPTYQLSRPVTARPAALQPAQPPPTVSATEPQEGELETVQESPARTPALQRTWSWQRQPPVHRTHSITSTMTDSHYAVLPPGVRLDDWTEEDMEALDDHVRHMLHSKKSKFNQKMKAFGQYVRRPLGFCVTLYATLITLFGLAWVLFLIGWIYVGDKQGYVVNVVDNVLVALFALVGDGMAPFRIVDTYHMIYIAHYHHLTWRLRKEKALPELQDRNDLPEQREKEADPEAANAEESEFSVLSQSQQKKLIHHQQKFSKSHSFYKPHETSTHHAFPLRLLVAVVVLLDCHSLFQIALGTCTWAIPYQTRPQALTATILSCSITVNITAGILISIGDRRTRKKEVVMRMARQELTQEAIKKVEKHKADREANVDRAARAEGFHVSKDPGPDLKTDQ